MKKRLYDWIFVSEHSEFIFSVMVSLLTIVLGILMSALNWSKEILLCLGIINIVFVLILLFIKIIWLYRLNDKKKHKLTCERIQYDKIMQTAKNEYIMEYGIAGNSLLVKSDEIALSETNGNYKEIWLVTSDLSTEIGEGAYSSAVLNNLLNSDVIYRYYVPNTDIVKLRMERLIEKSSINGKKNPNLFFYILKDNFFSLVPDFDFSIYISKDSSTTREGYMGYIVNQDHYTRSKNFEIKMTTDFINAIYAKLSSIKDNYEQEHC